MTEQTAPAIGSKLPLLFSYRDTLFGNGFVVHVEAKNGRALCVPESDGYWMYGVNPGGMAANGEDPVSARAAFRKAFSSVLVDIAKEAGGFEQFRAAVEAFFNETNEGYEQDWDAAVLSVRNREVSREGFPVAPANSPRSIVVSVKKIVSAEDNTADLQAQIAA